MGFSSSPNVDGVRCSGHFGVAMIGNDWLLLLLYFSFTINIVPHSYAGRPVRIRCSPISVPNGSIKLRHAGRMARFTCNRGYKLIGDRVAICHNNIWDDIPRCVKDVECPKEFPNVLNGKMVLYNYVYFKVICNYGFKIPDGSGSIFPCEKFLNPNEKPPVCQLTDTHFCDFEEGMCGWNNTVPYFSWIRYQNATPSHSLNTGPGGDHTSGTGHYLYIEASGLSTHEERFAKIIRRFLKIDTPEVCFVFWYHMYGHSIGTLDVYVDYNKVFTKSGNLGDKWRKGIIQRLPSDHEFYISLVATTASGYAGDIAIDDIGLVNSTDCTKLLIDVSCKNRCFEPETNATLCKCSSECLIDSTCCSDFMQFCSADASTSAASSETAERISDMSPSASDSVESTTYVDYSLVSDMGLTNVGRTRGYEISPYETSEQGMTASSEYSTGNMYDETTGITQWTEDQTVVTDSVIKITEGFRKKQKHRDSAFLPRVTDLEHKNTMPTSIDLRAVTEKISTPSKFLISTVVPLQDVNSVSYYLSTSGMSLPTTPLGSTAKTIAPSTSRNLDELSSTYTKGPTSHSSIAIRTSSISDIISTVGTTAPVTSAFPPTTSKSIPRVTTISRFELVTSTSTIHPSVQSTLNPSHEVQPEESATSMIETTVPPTESDDVDIVLGHTHLPPFSPSDDDYDQISESTELDAVPIDPHKKMLLPVTTNPLKVANKPSEAPYKWKKTYVPKGHYTFSAVRSETRTTTYVSIAVGILVFLAAAVVVGFLFIKRRHGPSRFRGSTMEESDVLYMTSDEILDFSVSRRPNQMPNRSLGLAPSAPTSSEQMLCTNDYSL